MVNINALNVSTLAYSYGTHSEFVKTPALLAYLTLQGLQCGEQPASEHFFFSLAEPRFQPSLGTNRNQLHQLGAFGTGSGRSVEVLAGGSVGSWRSDNSLTSIDLGSSGTGSAGAVCSSSNFGAHPNGPTEEALVAALKKARALRDRTASSTPLSMKLAPDVYKGHTVRDGSGNVVCPMLLMNESNLCHQLVHLLPSHKFIEPSIAIQSCQ